MQKILDQNQQLLEDIRLESEPIQKTIRVDKGYAFISGDKSIPVIGFDFKVKFSVETPVMPIYRINRYTDSQKTIAQIARWRGKEGDAIKELLFIGIPKTGES